jgi:hypothetical protein
MSPQQRQPARHRLRTRAKSPGRLGKLPPHHRIEPEMPLRLDVAAALEYPDGSMTASGLRREAARGRLVIERTAGKDYTTLNAIREMRRLCRLTPNAQDYGSAPPARRTAKSLPAQPTSSSMPGSITPQDALRAS